MRGEAKYDGPGAGGDRGRDAAAIACRRAAAGAAVVFDFGEWKSEMATTVNPDGTTSLLTILPGFAGLELVVGATGGKRTLTIRDAQHEYVFVER